MPSNVSITQFEPVVFMRGGSGRDARGRFRPVNASASPSHVRALLTLELQKACKIRDIQVSFSGLTHTDWPEGIGPNRLELAETTQIFKNIVTIWSAKEDHALNSRSRRRANSIGPGVNGAPGDEDWTTFSDASLPSAGIGGSAGPEPIAGASATQNGPSSGSSSSGGGGSGGGGGSSSSSGIDTHNLARSIAGVAARAGTAIMPATIRNELAYVRKGKAVSNGSASGRDVSTAGSGRSPIGRQWSAGSSPTRANLSMSMSHAPSSVSSASASMNTPRAHPGSVVLRPGEEGASMPTAVPLSGISDQPPTYDEAATPPASGSGPPSSAGASRPGSYFDAQPSSVYTGDAGGFVQSPGILHHSTNAVRLRSPPAVHFDAATGEGPSIGNLSFARTMGRSTTPTLPPPPSSSTSSDRKNSGSVTSGLSMATGVEGRSKKSGGTLKSLIGGLLLSEKNEDDACHTDWKLFKPGVYQFPVTVQLPSDLPPTLHADFGHNSYHLRALVRRVGALTSNLMAEREVTLIHSPEDDGTTDATDLIVVQRTWEDALAYMVVVSGKTFPIKSATIPLWMKLAPLDKVRVHRITASIEERTSYFAKGRMTARHEVPRRWHLLKLAGEDPSAPLLPVLSDASDALQRSPLVAYAPRDTTTGEVDEDAVSSLLDPAGPWELYLDLRLPTHATSSINISSSHVKSNVQVAHTLRVTLRVSHAAPPEDGGGPVPAAAKPKQFDIIIEAPITLTHSHTAEAWVSLPSYWTLPAVETPRQPEAAADASSESDGAPFGIGTAHGASDGQSVGYFPPPAPSRSHHLSRSPSETLPARLGSTASGSGSQQQLARAYSPRVPGPSPVALRTAGPQRVRSPRSGTPSSSSLASSSAGTLSQQQQQLQLQQPGAASTSGTTEPGGSSTTAAGAARVRPRVGARPNSASGPSLTGSARELSRQWLALSSGVGVGMGTGSRGGPGRGGSSSGALPASGAVGGVVMGPSGSGAAAAVAGGDEPPPPDYHSAVG